MTKVRIFVDFWNLQLSLNDLSKRKFWVDYSKFSVWLIQNATTLVGDKLDFDGMKVYLSYNPATSGDKKLLQWANNVLALMPGINISTHERRTKGPPICQSCHKEITVCGHCGSELHRTIEKGVDTSIVTDLLGLAWEKAWDVAILVSADRDYIPAVSLLSTKGFRVINAYVPPTGKELVKVCWANINMAHGLSEFELKKA